MAKVDIDLVANIQGATKSVQKFANKASSAVGSISDSFLNLKTLAAGAIAGIGFSKLISAAAEQEQAVQKLNTALALSGELSEENTQSFLDFTSALQANSTVGDEVSLGLIGLAKSFGASNDQAKQVLQTAADLSAVTGESLESSVRNLSKTLGGLKGELGETQPELRGLTKAQLENGKAIDLLSKKYAGAAKALTKTFSGALTQASNSFGDLLEKVGAFITSNPAVIASINLAAEIFNELGQTIDENNDVFDSLISDGLLVVTDILPTVIRLFGNFVVGLKTIQVTFEAVKLGAVAFALDVAKAFDQLLKTLSFVVVGGFDPIIKATALVVKGLEAVGAVADGTSDDFAKFSDNITDSVFTVGQSLGETVGSLTELRKEARSSLSDTASSVSSTVVTFENAALRADSFSTRIKILTEEAKNSGNSLQTLSDSNKNLGKDALKAAQDIADESGKLGDLKKSAEDAKDSLDSLGLKPIEINVKPKVLKPDDTEAKGPIKADVIPNILEPKGFTALLDPKNLLPLPAVQEPDFFDKFASDFSVGISNLKGIISNNFSPSVGNFVNAANTLVGGAEGAKKFLQDGSALVADAFLPGLGQAVGPLVGALSEGPEFVKQQVTAFADAIPDLLNNIAQAIPVLVEVIADKAPEIIAALVKAAPAISKAIIVSLSRLPFILAQEFAIEIARAIDDAFGTTISTDFEAAADKFAGTAEDLQEKYLSSVEDGVTRITGSLQTGLNTFTSGIQSALGNLGAGLQAFVSSIGSGIQTALTDIGNQIGEILLAPIKFYEDLFASFNNFKLPEFSFPALPEFTFPALPEFSFPALPEFSFPPLPDLGQQLIDGFDNVIGRLKDALKIEVPNIGGGGGGGGGFIGQASRALGFASGGRVPDGFPNDSFPARLSSNEEVIDTQTSERLRDFLSEQDAGKDVNISLQIGEKQLADILVNINRQGFRVTP